MFELLKPFLARVAGSAAGAVAAWLASKGIALQAGDTAALISAMMGVFGVVYSVIHILVTKKVGSKK